MSFQGMSVTKQMVKLIGVAFGLAIALFLFSAIASGHSYHADQASHAATVQVAHHASGGIGHRNGHRYGNSHGNRYNRGYNYRYSSRSGNRGYNYRSGSRGNCYSSCNNQRNFGYGFGTCVRSSGGCGNSGCGNSGCGSSSCGGGCSGGCSGY